MEAGSEQEKWRSITASIMRETLNIPTIESELRARRVKRLQSIARQPEENRSLLAALTGKFAWDSSIQLSAGGRAMSVTNPWLAQFLCDLWRVAEIQPSFATQFARQGWYAIFSSVAFQQFD